MNGVTVALSGGAGFLGSHLVSYFQQKDIEVIPLKLDLMDNLSVEKAFAELSRCDVYFHFAGLSSLGECLQNPQRAFQINSLGPSLAYAAFNAKFPESRFVFVSSSQIYDPKLETLSGIISEEHSIKPYNLYGRSKWMAEMMLADSVEKGQSQVIVLRLFNHVHKSQRPDFFLSSVYQQILNKKSDRAPVVLELGQLDLMRDMGALQDFLIGCEKIVVKGKLLDKWNVFNLGSGVCKNLRSLVQELGLFLNCEIQINLNKKLIRGNDPKMICADITKFSKTFDWKPQYSLNEKQLIQSFLSEITAINREN